MFGFWSKKDWWKIARSIISGMFTTLAAVLYNDMKALVAEAQELERKPGETKLEFGIRKFTYVVKKFILTHDEIEEWDDTLSDMMNSAIREIKGRDLIPSRFKIPKWLKIDIN